MFNSELSNIHYLHGIKNFPLLTPEAEYSAACDYKETHNKRSADILISSHLRLVVKIAHSLRSYGLPVEELISEGNIGLVTALDKFDPSKEYRFSTYAMWWIKAYMQKYILSNSSMVKMGTTSAQKKLFFNLRKVEKKLQLLDNKSTSDNDLKLIAENLGLSVKDTKEMSQRMAKRDTSLNRKVDDSDDTAIELQDLLVDKRPNQEDAYSKNEIYQKQHEQLRSAMIILNEREKDILVSRRLLEKSKTLEELSNCYNISKERVRQIELYSISKLRKRIIANSMTDDNKLKKLH